MISQEHIRQLQGKPPILLARLVCLAITVLLDHLSQSNVQLDFTVVALIHVFCVEMGCTAPRDLRNQFLVWLAVYASPHLQYDNVLLVHIVHKTAQLKGCVGEEVTVSKGLCKKFPAQLEVFVVPRPQYNNVFLVHIVHRKAQLSRDVL